jgi:arylformamidase
MRARLQLHRILNSVAMKHSSKWIDVSIPVNNSMHTWPGDPPTFISMHAGLAKGDVCNVSALQMSSHCGTHMDSPAHFLRDGETMDDLPWDAVVGPARLVEIQDPESINSTVFVKELACR